MHGVIGLLDRLAAIVEPSVAQQEAISAQCQILLVVAGNSVGDNDRAGAIKFSAPAAAGGSRTELHSAVHFRIGVRLVTTFIPSPAAEKTDPVVERLLEIYAEAIFDGRVGWMRGDFRVSGDAGL